MPLMQKVAVHPMSIMKDKKDSKDGAKGKDGAKVSQNNLVFLFIFVDLCWNLNVKQTDVYMLYI